MADAHSVLLFFIDGLGIGSRGPANPLDGLAEAEPLAIFRDEEPQSIFDGVVVPTDPRLGIPGRPQSASGQTTILTGVNAPKLLGYHKQGFPNAAMIEIIRAHSLFLQLKTAGVSEITFANAYRSRFFTTRPRWVSATTAAVEAAQVPFRTLEDLSANKAVFHDFTNQFLIEHGMAVEPRSPAAAGEVLASIAASNRFTLYEHFITDKAGHAQDYSLAQNVLRNLAAMLRETLRRLDLTKTTVIMTSDHGNIEDLSSRNHTLNDVPTIVWGAARDQIAARVRDLADITPAIVAALTEPLPLQSENG